MKVMGIDFDAKTMSYVVVASSVPPDERNIVASGKLQMAEPRSAEAVRAFSKELRDLISGVDPQAISIRAKPENGQMRAGSAALKMEALVLAWSHCPVHFPSAQRVLKAAENHPDIYAYQQGAWKAAVAGFDPEPKVKPRKKTAKK